jgi:Helix-turn-helix domain
VLFVLAEFYNRQDKIAWPDQETLARDASISERTLIRVLQVLETPRRNHPKGI